MIGELKRESLPSKVLVEESELFPEAFMIKNSIRSGLLQNPFAVLERPRAGFQQAWVYGRAVGLVLGEIFNFGRHTVRQG